MEESLDQMLAAVRGEVGDSPWELAVVLGSGLGGLVDQASPIAVFEYRDFDCFPRGSVAGHAGRLVAATLEGRRVLLFQGRFHLYQGLNAWQVALPVRLAHRLGCRQLLLTNAVGGINPAYRPGDFMAISDHINLLGDNPLRGLEDNPFVDLSSVYDLGFYEELSRFAKQQGIGLHQGVLAALSGPCYETPAEIRMLQRFGADVVSMSTVPEAIMAKYLKMAVAGLSFVSNAAAGISENPLDHQDVLAAGQRGSSHFSLLARQIVRSWSSSATLHS